MNRSELERLAKGIRYDLTAAQGKLSELLRELAALDLPNATLALCDDCGSSFRGINALAEHAYLAHAGPVPPNWERAEALAAD